MSMSFTHVCLVSAQPIPNLIPIRMEEFRPEKVILLESPDMRLQAERLEKVITNWSIKVERIPIEAYNLESAHAVCMKILSEHENKEIILNATGGTKIMAFAAYEAFRTSEKKIIYVDTQDGWIQTLSPEPERIDFQGVLKVPTYLNAYGQYILHEKTDKDRINIHTRVLKELVYMCDTFQDEIRTLNGYVAPLRNARSFPLKISVKKSDYGNPNFIAILELFRRHDILRHHDGFIELPDLESVEFVSGGWLEEYVFYVVDSLPVTDVRMGVEVKWDVVKSTHTMNEYDVVFTHKNRLFLIECKTKRFEGTDTERYGDEPIYKLESLRDAAGGVYGKGMLVSYQRLTDAQRIRLSANRLAFCDGSELKNLKNKILEWVG